MGDWAPEPGTPIEHVLRYIHLNTSVFMESVERNMIVKYARSEMYLKLGEVDLSADRVVKGKLAGL